MSGPATARAELLDRARGGERRALAQLISAAERGEALPALPAAAPAPHSALCIGVTGAPGAGKSTLVGALTTELLKHQPSIAVLAIDPSSPLSHGALLGDRLRMPAHAASPRISL